MKKASPPLVLRYATVTTPVGELLAVASDRGLVALRVAASDSVATLLKQVRGEHPGADLQEDERGLQGLLGQVQAVIQGERPASSVPVDLRGTPFQKRVWEALMRVPWGAKCTYSDLAKRAGNPQAVRAAASACARNPITFVVPCHRIIRKNGGLGGYGWGLPMKERLLAREQET